MGSARDITKEFKACVRAVAVKRGMDEEKIMKSTSSMIMPKIMERSPFTNSATQVMKSINTLHTFIRMHEKDFTDYHRHRGQNLDSIDNEVGLFVKTCREGIEVLKNSIATNEPSIQNMWLGGLSVNPSNAQLVAHQHGVVLILSEKLHSVTAHFDRLRTVRFQEAIEKTVPRFRRAIAKTTTELVNDMEGIRQESQHAHEIRHQLLDDETQVLQLEITNLLDAAQETERKVIEVSALNHFFSTHVLQQSEQIEMLYKQAVAATENVEKGNKEIRKTIERSSSSRTFLIMFFVILPLALLFLHWYN